MDTMKDILSDKVSAESIIRANEDAVKRDEQRKNERLAEYEQLVEDIKRLQFKGADINEQTSQLIASAIEKIEEYSGAANVDVSGDIAPIRSMLDEARESRVSMEGELVQARDALRNLEVKLDEMKSADNAGDENRKHIEEHVHRENVRVYRNVQAVVESQGEKTVNELKTELEKIKKSMGVMKTFNVITVLAVLISLAVTVLNLLGIIG